MSKKPSAPRIEASSRAGNGQNCRGAAPSSLRLSRRPGPLHAPGAPRQPSWLQRAAAYFGAEESDLQTGFGASQFGVGATG
jgi:hypothetical protein